MRYNWKTQLVETSKPTALISLGTKIALLVIFATITAIVVVYSTQSFVAPYASKQTPEAVTGQSVFAGSIREALSSMIIAESIVEQLTAIKDPEIFASSADLRETLESAASRFQMHIAAITLGSDSEEFALSRNGRDLAAWNAEGLGDQANIPKASGDTAALADQTNLYFESFLDSAYRAIDAQNSRFELALHGSPRETENAILLSEMNATKAREFANLVSKNLRVMDTTTTLKQASAKQPSNITVPTIVTLSLLALLAVVVALAVFQGRRLLELFRGHHASNLQVLGTKKPTAGAMLSPAVDGEKTLTRISDEAPADLRQYTNRLESEIEVRTKDLQQKLKELDANNELLRKREEELTRANERLLDIDKAKSEFISIAAHQLRTPLAAIKWTLSLLVDENTENLTPEQKSLLMKGYESNERMIGLINEMLVVTRIESGRVEIKLTPIHLEDVADSVLLDFSGQAHVRHIHLSREKLPTHSPLVNADPDMMRSVMQNLVENAMRYTPDGGTILLTITPFPTEVTVTIKDSGIGIPIQQTSSIFNKFFRADNAAKLHPNGSGLGLYIVKSFVERHGGKIWFDSTLGSGTTFTFTIPVTTPPKSE